MPKSTTGGQRPFCCSVTLGQRVWVSLAAPLFFPSHVGSKETWKETEKLHHSGKIRGKNGLLQRPLKYWNRIFIYKESYPLRDNYSISLSLEMDIDKIYLPVGERDWIPCKLADGWVQHVCVDLLMWFYDASEVNFHCLESKAFECCLLLHKSWTMVPAT